VGKFLLVLVLVAACVIGLGFYLGWFTVATAGDTPGKSGVNVTIDRDKIKSDAERARQKAGGVFHRGTTQTTTTRVAEKQ
jgi:hypothetical protein